MIKSTLVAVNFSEHATAFNVIYFGFVVQICSFDAIYIFFQVKCLEFISVISSQLVSVILATAQSFCCCLEYSQSYAFYHNGEDYQNCSVLYFVLQYCTVICTHIKSSSYS